MQEVIVVGTMHTGFGACNSQELYKIIKRIAPQTIFEEISPNKFELVYSGRLGDSLETATIKMYLNDFPVGHYPVDLDVDHLTEVKLRHNFERMSGVFHDYSPEYNWLIQQRESLAYAKGFPYLNSESCRKLLERKSLLEYEIVSTLSLPELSLAYADYSNLVEMRRNEMIDNIYRYHKASEAKTELYLVGVEHTTSIMERLSSFELNSGEKLEWKLL